jgi:hypothetical protein
LSGSATQRLQQQLIDDSVHTSKFNGWLGRDRQFPSSSGGGCSELLCKPLNQCCRRWQHSFAKVYINSLVIETIAIDRLYGFSHAVQSAAKQDSNVILEPLTASSAISFAVCGGQCFMLPLAPQE